MMYRMKEPDEIVALYEQRQLYYGKGLARMREMQRLMNNEMEVPLPELQEGERSLVANIALRAQDNLAERFASLEPMMHWPSTDPGKPRADNRARDRRRVMQGWHEENDMYAIRSKRCKHFLSWATSPVIIRPDRKTRRPKWDVRRPLETFLPPGTYDELLPHDVISCQVYSYQELLSIFDKDLVRSVRKPPSWNWDNDLRNYAIEFEVLEYIDEHEWSMILVGASSSPDFYHRHQPNMRSSVRLMYSPNFVGRPLIVCPGRICLDEQLGHFDGVVGMYQARAAMTVLGVVGQRKAVWPTTWVDGFPNDPEDPDITQDPDPFRGVPGMISHGRISQAPMDPSFRTLEYIDRMTEEERREAGIPAEMLGTSKTHISGSRGAQVMGATIDLTLSAAHNRFARSLKEEDKLAAEVDVAWFNQKKVYFIETRGYIGNIEYVPEELWETTGHVVDYPLAGTDLQNLPIEGGQRVQMETMSAEDFMDLDPLIKDKETTIQRLDREALKRAFKAMMQNMAANPDPNAGIQPRHLAELDAELESGTELLRAFIKVDDKIKAQQQAAMEAAAVGAPPTAQGQPGTATPGAAGTPEAGSAIPEPPDSLSRFTQLLGSLGTTQQAQRFRS